MNRWILTACLIVAPAVVGGVVTAAEPAPPSYTVQFDVSRSEGCSMSMVDRVHSGVFELYDYSGLYELVLIETVETNIAWLDGDEYVGEQSSETVEIHWAGSAAADGTIVLSPEHNECTSNGEASTCYGVQEVRLTCEEALLDEQTSLRCSAEGLPFAFDQAGVAFVAFSDAGSLQYQREYWSDAVWTAQVH